MMRFMQYAKDILLNSPLFKISHYHFRNQDDLYINSDSSHDDYMTWKHFPLPAFLRTTHQSWFTESRWYRPLIFPLLLVWTNYITNSSEAGDLRRLDAHVTSPCCTFCNFVCGNLHSEKYACIRLALCGVMAVLVTNGFTHIFSNSKDPRIDINKTSASIGHRSDTEVSDRCQIDVDPRVIAI